MSVLCFLILMSACAAKTTEQNTLASEHNMELGLAYLEKGNYSRAEYKLQRAVMQDPNSNMAQSALAYLYAKMGETQKAEQAYKKSIQLAPKEGAMYNNYAVFLCEQGQYEKAKENFMKAVKMPEYPYVAEAFQNAENCTMTAESVR